MAPEYGATCGIFPVDEETLRYLRFSGRSEEQIALVEAYCKEQGLFHTESTPEAIYSDTVELDLSTVEPSMAGPKRPQDRVTLSSGAHLVRAGAAHVAESPAPKAHAASGNGHLQDGSVVIAAITSCTNTSNPYVLVAAGLLAKKAVEKGLATKPWVKTSLAPGSKVVTEYLTEAGADDVSRKAEVQPGGLRLHHVHRQLRAAALGDLARDPGQRTGRGFGALRQPQL